MNIRVAMLCLDDDEIFEGTECPRCSNRAVIPIRSWLSPAVFGVGKVGRRRRVPRGKKSIEQEIRYEKEKNKTYMQRV